LPKNEFGNLLTINFLISSKARIKKKKGTAHNQTQPITGAVLKTVFNPGV
jgi:hypothetical protein